MKSKVNFNKYYFLIFLFCLNSCAKRDLYSERKVPQENTAYLNDSFVPNQEKPNTKPIYGYTSPKVQENPGFYDSIFQDKKQKTIIQDEVANNNIKKIKEEVTKETIAKTGYFIQIGAYSNRNNAYLAREKISTLGNVNFEQENKLLKVQLGPVKTKEEAKNLQKKLASIGYEKTLIINKK